jgi:probable F420-dependent oxidoreductase
MYPGDELQIDADGLDRWIESVEAGGFDHVLFGDHVLGMDPSRMPSGWDDRWPGRAAGGQPYTYRTLFREPMVLFGYLAARSKLELVTGVLVLPQRQTALVAKQAAEVDLLSRGRLRLSVGLGWSPIEYESMGADFAARGKRMDEQIEILRRFWTEDVVTFKGDFHEIRGAGIMELPVQRPIPIWTGAHSKTGFTRVGRLADGCLLPSAIRPSDGTLTAARDVISGAAEAAGRDPAGIGLEGRVHLVQGQSSDELRRAVEEWGDAGVTNVWIDTRYSGRDSLSRHLSALEIAGEALRG